MFLLELSYFSLTMDGWEKKFRHWNDEFKRTLQLGVGKRAGPPRLRPARISPHWQQTGPVCPRPVDLAGQTGRSVGLVLKEFQF